MKGKVLVEYFLWVLVSVAAFAAGMFLPLLSPLAVFAAPVPFLLFTCRGGPRVALSGAVTGTVIVFFALGAIHALIYLCSFALLGLVMGTALRRFENGTDYFLVSVAASAAIKLSLVGILTFAAGVNPFMLTPEAAESLLASLSGALSHGGIALSPDSVRDYAADMAAAVGMLMPSMIILLSACDTAAGYAAARLYSRKDASVKVPVLPPFTEWRFPKNIFWALLAALALDMASKAMPDNPLCKMLSVNMMEVLRGIFLIEGLSLAWYFMTAYKTPGAVKYLALCAGLFFSPVSYFLSMVGVFDIWYDLRRRIKLRGKQK